MKKITSLISLIIFSVFAYAGGNPEFVEFPKDYKNSFKLYHTQNRANNKQVADMYANQIAIDSVKNGKLADGSIVIMEVYKPEVDEAGKPVAGTDGIFIKSKLAAVAVMEKSSDWSASFSSEDRTGDWGYAIYEPNGTPKANEHDCVSCHTPLEKEDYLFSFTNLNGE